MRVPLRPLGLVAATLALAAGASACADSAASPSASTVTIQPSSYVTKPVVTTTTAPGPGATTADGRSPVEQVYTVQPNDYPAKIAGLYDISIDELLNYNGITASEFPYPGETLKIPPNAKIPDLSSTDDTDPPSTDTDDGSSDGESTTTVGGDGCTGSYTIESGDYPGRVASKFDITVDALNAANAGTEGYSSFYVGLEIVIPVC